ncbi:MAG: formate dehydrogenase subunit gamma, partial [Pseudomonadota bacterium]|nr:formate dehydrogenase subunit gamma [Pseudomonadota bacterium]
APALPDPNGTNAERAKSQPGNNAPMWRAVRNSGNEPGLVNLPGEEKGVLVQRFVQYPGSQFTTAGEAWRQVRNDWLIPYGSAVLIIVVLGFAILYLTRGPIGKRVPDGGRLIERFTPFERAAHWANAIAFVVLAVSGIVMAFGKFFLLPIIGFTLFGWLTWLLKTLHNFAGPLFVVSLLVVLLTFFKDNFWNRADTVWVKRGGGLVNHAHVPAGRFNAGEKLVFWFGVLLLGFIVIGSGLVMDQLIPGMTYTRGDMQIAHMVHNTAAVLMMGMFIGHIYLGTIGMKGAYKAMRTGYVDENWARAHHDLWAEDVAAGRVPAQRSSPPARSPTHPLDPSLAPTGPRSR